MSSEDEPAKDAASASETPKTCYEKLHHQLDSMLPNLFSRYCDVLSNKVVSYVSIVLCLMTLIVVSSGLYRVEYETQLEETWVDNDSRLVGEKDFYEQHFGGISYAEFSTLSSRAGNAINTKTMLSALQYIMAGWNNHAETCPGCGAAGTVTNPRQISFKGVTDAGAPVTLYQKDVCDSNPPPKSLAGCLTCTLDPPSPSKYAYVATSGNLPVAWGYAALSRCLHANQGTTNTGAIPRIGVQPSDHTFLSDWFLPVTWGVDRLPCSSFSILNAFSEGKDAGWPACLQALETSRWKPGAPARLKAHPFGTADALYWWVYANGDASRCLGIPINGVEVASPTSGLSVYEQYKEALQAGGKTTLEQVQIATQWTVVLRGWIENFQGFGYRHKPSFVDLAASATQAGATDDGAAIIADFLDTAIKNQQLGTVKSATECATTFYTYMTPKGSVLSGPLTHPWTSACFRNGVTSAFTESLVLGTARGGSAAKWTSFKSVRSVMHLYHKNAPNLITRLKAHGISTSSGREGAVDTWQGKMFDYLNAFWKQTDINFAPGGAYADIRADFFQAKKSFADGLKETASFETNGWYLASAFFLLMAFSVGWYLPRCGAKHSVVGLMCVGFGGVILAIVAGYGMIAWIGINFSVTTPVVGLVALGLGLDDIYVLLNAYKHALVNEKESVLLDTFVHAGPSITITTLSNIVGFSMGYTTPIPAVQTFCLQMVTTCAFMLLSIMCIIFPVVALHSLNSTKDSIGDKAPVPDLQGNPRSADNQDVATSESCGSDVSPGTKHVRLNILNDAMVKADEPEPESSSAKPVPSGDASLSMLMHRFCRDRYAPVLMTTAAKCIVMAISVVMLALSIWASVSHLKLGLSLKELSNKGTYQYDFWVQQDQFTALGGTLVSRQSKWDSTAIQTAVANQDAALQTSPWISDANPIKSVSWMQGSLYWFGGVEDKTAPNDAHGDDLYTVTPPSSFNKFTQWGAVGGASNYEDKLICHTTQTSGVPCYCTDSAFPDRRITIARHVFVHVNLKDTDAYVSAIKNIREVTDAGNVNGNDSFAYGIAFLYYEQYLEIVPRLIKLCALCISGIVVLNLFLQVSFSAAALTAVLLSVYVMQMIGSIVLLDIKLNSFSLVNIVVSIGFAVEYIVHYTRAFLIATGTRDERTQKALAEIGPATLAGGFTAFLAMVPLGFSGHLLFRLYFFSMFSMAALLGVWNGIVLWPVVLSWIGPDSTTRVLVDVGDDKIGQNEPDDTEGQIKHPC